MGSPGDRVSYKEDLSVSIQRGETTFPQRPCPSCGSETKEHHPKRQDGKIKIGLRRICSKCREVFDDDEVRVSRVLN